MLEEVLRLASPINQLFLKLWRDKRLNPIKHRRSAFLPNQNRQNLVRDRSQRVYCDRVSILKVKL